MILHLQKFLDLQAPLPEEIKENRANCFNAVQLFWSDKTVPDFTGPGEFVDYLEAKFDQLSSNEKQNSSDVVVVWSRSSSILPVGKIQIGALSRRDPGYPFGLIIEHAFVILDQGIAFQKRDPSEVGPYELVSLTKALEPYLESVGLEVTHHRRR